MEILLKGVVDPTKVTRSALQNAASVAGLVFTTDAMIADAPRTIVLAVVLLIWAAWAAWVAWVAWAVCQA